MRLKYKKTYYVKPKTTTTDAEGGKYASYGTAAAIEADIYPASGKLQAEMYGERLNYILNMLCDSTGAITEGDGVCVYVASSAEPDYRVLSIKRYSHMVLELEKL